LSDTFVIIGCLGFLFVLVPVGLVLGYKHRRRLRSNVQAVSETAFMALQNQSKRRAMEQVQYARENEEEQDDAGEARGPTE
jgi:hypothetical protein